MQNCKERIFKCLCSSKGSRAYTLIAGVTEQYHFAYKEPAIS